MPRMPTARIKGAESSGARRRTRFDGVDCPFGRSEPKRGHWRLMAISDHGRRQYRRGCQRRWSSDDSWNRKDALPDYPTTPDNRYFIVRGRLWRQCNPALDQDTHDRLVAQLMAARRAVRDATAGSREMADARGRVNDAKVALGERGTPWWNDGAPDYNRHLVRNTPYAEWYAALREALP